MTANELTNSWEQNLKPNERHGNHAETMYWIEQYRLFGDKAATMLRQQQAEIEALKSRELTDEEIDDFTVKIYNCRTGAEAHEIVLAILRKAQEK